MNTKKCPVCDWEIMEMTTTVTVDGKDIVVCCQECADKLATDAKSADGARKGK